VSGKWAVLAIALGVSASCGRINYDGLWDQVVVVTFGEDRLAGDDTILSVDDLDPGTVGLSLREAIIIANNTPEHDLIVFDPKFYKPGAGTQLVLESTLPRLTGDGTAIDARAADVTLVADFGRPAFEIEANDILLRNMKLSGSAGCGLVDVFGGERITIEGNAFDTPGSGLIATLATELNLLENSMVATEDDGFRISESSGVTIRGNTMTDLLGRGLVITDTNNVRIQHNYMEHVAGDQMVIRDGTNINVEFNEVLINNKTTQKGVQFIRVHDSRVCDNFIDPGAARLIALEDSNNNQIEGNILDRGDIGVALMGTSTENMVFRNIVIQSAEVGLYITDAAIGNTLVHNTIHASGGIAVSDESTQTIGNNLITDASLSYLDPRNYDYHLAPGSEHIDAGELLGYDCVPGSSALYWGAAPDLGAVETK
jgi:parallel beta-helix repeat protein